MGHSASKRFEMRFKNGIEVLYCTKPVDGEEKQLIQQKLSTAVKAVLTSVLKREPTSEELLGLVPISADRNKGVK